MPWVVTTLVVLLLGVSLDAVDLVAPDPLGGTAARFLPSEGQRTVAVSSDGVETVTEHSRSVGIEGAFAAPSAITLAVLSALDETELLQAQWWRATRVSDAGDRVTDLYRASPEGIAQIASWGGPLGFVFEPELMVLPATVKPGDTWNGDGSALGDGLLTYTATSTALLAVGPYTDVEGREIPLTGGCLGVDSTVRIENPDDGSVTDLVESTLWCPGRGVVWSTGTVDDQPFFVTEVRLRAMRASADALPAATAWSDAAESAADLFSGGTLPLTISDAFFGESDAHAQFSVPPASTRDGRLITANDRGDDIQVWRLENGAARLDWAGHPGGVVVAVGAVDDLVIATTAQRKVVAYDAIGRRLWSWAADELVIASPRAAGDADSARSAVLIVSRSGMVTALDAASGIPRWSTPLGADARAETAVAGGLVFVADERERLTALNAATGAVVWTRDLGLTETLAVDADGGLVVAMLESGAVVGVSLVEGDERFRVRYRGIARGLALVGGVVLALSDERLVALDGLDGAVRWNSGGGEALVGEGAAVAVVGASSVVLLSATNGAVIAAREIDAGAVSSGRLALAVADAVVIVDSDGLLQRWELR